MRVSVIICTFGRADALADLLESLERQSFRDFETLIVDGNDEPSMARKAVWTFLQRSGIRFQADVIACPKGLTRQRNLGLDRAQGEILCFLDDDVTLPDDFLLRAVEIFDRVEFQDIGGLTGYDQVNYSAPVTLRWRLRRALGVIPDLPPGGVDRLGRGIPLSFLQPFTGFREIGLLPGFCMIYRRNAIGTQRFDELIPTYAGEDRDFSMQIGWRSRMLICGDLVLHHHASPQGRDSNLDRNFQSAFGMGRRFAKYCSGTRDYVTMVSTFLADLVIDIMFLVSHPIRANLLATLIRIKGFVFGLRSEIVRPPGPPTRRDRDTDLSARQSRNISSLR